MLMVGGAALGRASAPPGVQRAGYSLGAARREICRARGARADRAAAGGGDESQSDREYDLAYKFNNTGPVSRPACMSLPTAPRGRVERVVILPTIDSTSGSSNSVPVGCRAKIY